MAVNEEKVYVALDLGASSGRAMLARYNGGTLTLEEVHRFDNGPVDMEDGLHWDADYLFDQMKKGLARAVEAAGDKLVSIGVDTWGVDYALLDANGNLLSQPFNYRDSRTDGMMEKTFEIVPKETIFEKTGLQFMQINTLFQLMSEVLDGGERLAKAETLLMMADLFNYWLSGRKASEHTLASTSQCFNPCTGTWAADMLEELKIPSRIFPEVVEAGCVLGELKADIAKETSARGVSVVAVGSHDTASAVAATPAKGENFAYLSSGTWSLLGMELKSPIINKECLASNFTNEGGVLGTIRLLKNATGLWLVQECRRIWKEQGEDLSFDEMESLADDAEPFTAFVDPDAAEFQSPCDMPENIRAYCRRTKQTVPADKGALLRVIFESLALKSRKILENAEHLAGNKMGVLHIVGGGSKNRTLNQYVADAIGRRVVAGPAEATALGNVMMQMIAMDDLQSVEDGRSLIRRSFELENYDPSNAAGWAEAYAEFERMFHG